MKIICIGRNYGLHASELGNKVPTEPVFFIKSDNAVLRPGYDFYYPDFSKEVHYELEFFVRFHQMGKNIQTRFAHKYYDQWGLGIDFTARDLQSDLKSKGLPWEKSKSFDMSAAISPLRPITELEAINDLDFELHKNGETVQTGNTGDMIFSVNELIAYVSNFLTIKKGDLLFTGTPAGVGAIAKGDHLSAFAGGRQMLDLKIR
jgi:2-keto-4-pentenoate hydratase/2-oxohepta-3-ene-1,7-dioic acid hydratase in catechol pathway